MAIVALATVALAGLASASPARLPIRTLTLAAHSFQVEIATTDSERETGLMFRERLAGNHGMWFVFPNAALMSFWMKNTLIPLDVLFFDSARHVVSMQLDLPPCRSDPCQLYPSRWPANYVLELPAGSARRFGLRVGDAATVR